MYGQVIGVSSAKIAATDYEGMGFAIPSATVKDVIDDIMKYGYVQGRVKIGVTGENVQSSGNTPAGIAIYSIDEDGPCANTDLKENDIITGADGKKVSKLRRVYDITSKPIKQAIQLSLNITAVQTAVQIKLP